jgi:hypothetical protein
MRNAALLDVALLVAKSAPRRRLSLRPASRPASKQYPNAGQSMDLQFKIGIGVAVIFGFLPFAVKDMPQWLSWGGIALGLGLIIWSIIPVPQRLPIGPMIVGLVGLALLAGAFGWYRDISKDTTSITRDAIAQLSGLGWSVKPQGDGSVQFEIANGPLPSIEKSAPYFQRMSVPFTAFLDYISWPIFPAAPKLKLMREILPTYLS